MLATELVRLLIDDETGRLSTDQMSTDYALAGALLVDLAALERIGFDSNPRPRRRRVRVLDASETGEPEFDKALALIGAKARKAEALIPRLSKGLGARLRERLASEGVLLGVKGRRWRIFPETTWHPCDPEAIGALRARIRSVIVTGLTPDEHTSALVGVLSAVDRAHRVIGPLDRAESKAARTRAREIAQGQWASAAVRQAIEAVQAMAAATAAIVAAGATTSS